MNKQVNVKQGTIVCQVCGKVIENVDNSEGLKHGTGSVLRIVLGNNVSVKRDSKNH